MSIGQEAFLTRFARKTSSTRYIGELDGLRFVAIALVLIFHVGVVVGLNRGSFQVVHPFGSVVAIGGSAGLLERVVRVGRVGVYLFFIISGFILALPFLQASLDPTGKPVDVPRYLLRRVTRIEPPYIISLVLLFVSIRVFQTDPGVSHLFAGLLYVHQPLYGQPNPINGVAWSLEVEIQWYLVVPLLAVLLVRGSVLQRRLWILVLATIALSVQFLDSSGGLRTGILLDNLQYFLTGWLIADVYVTEWRDRDAGGRTWDLIGLFSLPAMFALILLAEPMLRLTVPILGGLACAAGLRGPHAQRALRNPWIATIGGMCYSIYLLHYSLFLAVRKVVWAPSTASYSTRMAWWLLILAPLAIVTGALFFLVIEKPCMDPAWPQRFAGWVVRSTRRRRIATSMDASLTEVVITSRREVITSPAAPSAEPSPNVVRAAAARPSAPSSAGGGLVP